MDAETRPVPYTLVGERAAYRLEALEEIIRPDGRVFRVERYAFHDPERTRCDVTLFRLDPKGRYAWVQVGSAATMVEGARLALNHQPA